MGYFSPGKKYSRRFVKRKLRTNRRAFGLRKAKKYNTVKSSLFGALGGRRDRKFSKGPPGHGDVHKIRRSWIRNRKDGISRRSAYKLSRKLF